MNKFKLGKTDNKCVIITLVIGFILQFFIESGMTIALSGLFMYVGHKYLATTENLKEYDSYEFIDKDKYNKGKQRFVLILDLYLVNKIVSMLIKPQSTYVPSDILLIIEILSILMIYAIYELYLDKKYVAKKNVLGEKIKLVFVRNKLLVGIVLFIFAGFTYFTFNTLNELSSNDYVKYGKYEYNLSNINDKRKLEIQTSSGYMMGEENEKNSAHFDKYLAESKDLIVDQISRSYMFISMLLMLALSFGEIYPKNNKVRSVASNIFFTGFLVLSIFTLNSENYNKEAELFSYFHNYISK